MTASNALTPAPAPPADLVAGGERAYHLDMEARVAVLEQIAKDTRDALIGLRGDLTGLRTKMRGDLAEMRSEIRGDLAEIPAEIRGLRSEQRSDFRWLLGVMVAAGGGLLAVMAKGFHWY